MGNDRGFREDLERGERDNKDACKVRVESVGTQTSRSPRRALCTEGMYISFKRNGSPGCFRSRRDTTHERSAHGVAGSQAKTYQSCVAGAEHRCAPRDEKAMYADEKTRLRATTT